MPFQVMKDTQVPPFHAKRGGSKFGSVSRGLHNEGSSVRDQRRFYGWELSYTARGCVPAVHMSLVSGKARGRASQL